METIEITVDGTLRADAQQVLAEESLTIPEAFSMLLRTIVHDRTCLASIAPPMRLRWLL